MSDHDVKRIIIKLANEINELKKRTCRLERYISCPDSWSKEFKARVLKSAFYKSGK